MFYLGFVVFKKIFLGSSPRARAIPAKNASTRTIFYVAGLRAGVSLSALDSLKKLINNDGSLCVLYDFFLFSDEVLFFASPLSRPPVAYLFCTGTPTWATRDGRKQPDRSDIKSEIKTN